MTLMSDNLKLMSSFSLKQYIFRITFLYVIVNKNLFGLFS